tara:strand:- start:1194 stop:2450 length:1257 start_codon:yes stop_codon:yes gene_type:complete
MQQVVRLLGDLGERYGAEHTYFDLRTPADAIKLLCLNSPAFQQELIEAHEHGVGYRLIQAGEDLGLEDLQLPIGSNDLILTPVIAGSGGGTGKIFAGVALIAAAIVLAPAGAGFLGLGAGLKATVASGLATGFVAAGVSSAIGAIGLSLVIGGVSQMISPQPTIPKLGGNRLGSGEASSTDGPQSVTRGTDGRQSYAYTGAANTVGVGATIPVAYGEVLIGSHLLSANVEVTDESDPLKTAIKAPGADTVLFGGEKLSFGFSTASGVKAKRTTKNVNSSDDVRKAQNTFIGLGNGVTVEGNADIGEQSDARKRFEFMFEIRDGLFENVSGAGSTLVDGFITYRLSIINVISGPDQVVATSQATIQGLLLPGQFYRWNHQLEHPDVDDDLRARVEIIDFRANPSCRLFWQSYGYDLDLA